MLKVTLSEHPAQSVSGAVKLFASEEEMHTSTENNLDDLAVIYAPKIQNFTIGMEASILNFPQTVVLPEAQTTSQSIRFRTLDTSAYVDVSGGLTPEYFYLSVYGDSSSFNIEFTSTDGITYIRTDSSDSVQDLGTLLLHMNLIGQMPQDILCKLIVLILEDYFNILT